jgi:hypothetical protein
LIQEIYAVEQLLDSKCQGHVRIISFTEDDDVIRKILDHPSLWETRNHDPTSYIPDIFHDPIIDESYSQLLQFEPWLQ